MVVTEREQLPVQQARAGDAEVWNVLLKRYQLPLYAYVYELVHNEQTSLDIVQETFINAVRHIGSLADDAKFGSWLFGIAHQKCIQQWRRGRRHSEWLEQSDVPAESDDSPLDLLLREEDEAEFMKVLDQLSPPHRSVLLLHFIEEFSVEEIARITGAQPGTVKSRLHYAKQALKKLLEEPST